MTIAISGPAAHANRVRTVYKVHPFAQALPLMNDAEFAAFKANIAKHGQIDDVELFEGRILDGRHRDRACRELGIAPRYVTFRGTRETALARVHGRAHGRTMNDGQKACAAVNFMLISEKEGISREFLGVVLPVTPGGSLKTRDVAAGMFGVSPAYVAKAQFVLQHSPELFQQAFGGQLQLSQAYRAVHREIGLRRQARKAKQFDGKPNWTIHVADCVPWLEEQPPCWVKLIFADPPYNIGVDYGRGAAADRLPERAYLRWCYSWMVECHRLLRPDGSLWVVINDEHAAEFKRLLVRAGFTVRAWIKWFETFGVYNSSERNFGRTSRHLFYCTFSPTNFIFNANAVTRKSDRQTKYGDKRANPAGKIWDDVWQIPRLVENAAERVPGFKNQLPLDLVRPIVACCSDPGDVVLDPFTGSGTTAEAAVELGRRYVGTEICPKNAATAERRMRARFAGGARA
jgi:DNA modification methylase